MLMDILFFAAVYVLWGLKAVAYSVIGIVILSGILKSLEDV